MTKNYSVSSMATISKQTMNEYPSMGRFKNSSIEEQKHYINMYKYVLYDSTEAFRKKWSSYSLIDQYLFFYRKLHTKKNKGECGNESEKQSAPAGMMSIVDYIASSKIETLDLSSKDLKKLSAALPTRLEEVNIAIELKEEETKSLLINPYSSIHRKPYAKMNNGKCKYEDEKQSAPAGKMSIVDYIASSKIEVLDLSSEDLKKLSVALPKLLEEVNIAIELREEEAKQRAEKEEKLKNLEAQKKSIEQKIARIKNAA